MFSRTQRGGLAADFYVLMADNLIFIFSPQHKVKEQAQQLDIYNDERLVELFFSLIFSKNLQIW